MFGDDDKQTYDQKRKYYLVKFPNDFKKLKQRMQKLQNISFISRLEVSKNKIVLTKAGSLGPEVRDQFIADTNSMLQNDDPEIVNLALDLLRYAYYAKDLHFGPNSFGKFFGSYFLSSFNEYVGGLRNIGVESRKEYFKNYLPQFLANSGKQYLKELLS